MKRRRAPAATAVTDDNALATAPPLRLNAKPGTFTVTASVAHGRKKAVFCLTILLNHGEHGGHGESRSNEE